MSVAKTLAAVKRTQQFNKLISSGLRLVSTERQLSNGTLVFRGNIKAGRKIITPKYAVTANGAVISNENTIRRVKGETPIAAYRSGLEAISEVLGKRLAA